MSNMSDPTQWDEVNRLRVPPHSIEAESSVLGGLLLDNRAWDCMGDVVVDGDFYRHEHKLVYVAIGTLINASKPADVVTVHEQLQNLGKADEIGGLAYLNSLAQYVPSASNIRRYAEIVRERSILRKLISASDEIITSAFNPQGDSVDSILDSAAQRVMSIQVDSPRDEWVGAVEGMVEHTEVLEDRAEGKVRSWPTGLSALDDYLEGGLRPGALVVIGARPSHGKTALGMTIGLHMAAERAVALLSMEMPHRDVRDRMTALLGRVSLSSVIRPNNHGGLDWSRVTDGVDRAKTLRYFVSDQSGLNINQVRSKARSLKRRHGLDVLTVDYLGLMAGLDGKQSRAYQIEEITKGLKALAKELDIVVIALAQLNREIEKRANRRPMLSDFRDSGSIEQDADIVLGLHREAVDKPNLDGEWKSYAELAVLKNRQGRTGSVGLHYEGQQTRFSGWGGAPPFRTTMKRSGGFDE